MHNGAEHRNTPTHVSYSYIDARRSVQVYGFLTGVILAVNTVDSQKIV